MPLQFSRREVLDSSLALPVIVRRAFAQSARPNILWLTCEDMSPDLGCYGDTYSRSPNIDRLASEGVRYTKAFSVYGVCSPSRSSIITGMYPASIGTCHHRSQGVPPPEVKCFTEYLRAAGYYCTNNQKTDYNFAPPLTAWDESSSTAHWKNRAPGQPFFAVFNFMVTHESQIRADTAQMQRNLQRLRPNELHDPQAARLPAYYPDTPVVRRDWANYYDLITAMDYQVADHLNELAAAGLADDTIVFFYSDHGRGLPRAKRWLYDSSIHVPLIVRWPGRIQPGTVNHDLVSFVDLAPTVLSLAGIPIPRHLQGRAFLGDQRSRTPRRYIYGARDRMDETYDLQRCVRDERFKYIRNYQHCKPYAQYIDYMEQMPTMREWRRLNKEDKLEGPQKLFFAPEKPKEELYDTAADPEEVRNLAADPKYAATLARLRAENTRFVRSIGDMGFLPEDRLKERMRPGGHWSRTAEVEFRPGGGTVPRGTKVTLTCATPGSSIAYTFEAGDKPYWKLYSGPLTLDRSVTLRAKACRIGYHDSAEGRASFSVEA
jgi:uncharacterized sulfatase